MPQRFLRSVCEFLLFFVQGNRNDNRQQEKLLTEMRPSSGKTARKTLIMFQHFACQNSVEKQRQQKKENRTQEFSWDSFQCAADPQRDIAMLMS